MAEPDGQQPWDDRPRPGFRDPYATEPTRLYPGHGTYPNAAGWPEYAEPPNYPATPPGYPAEPPNYQAYQAPPGYQAYQTPPGYPADQYPYPAPRQNGKAIAALVLACIALFTCWLTWIPALVLGLMGLSQANASPDATGRKMSIAALVILGVDLLIALGYLGSVTFPVM